MIGVPHSRWGEVPKAFVVLKPGQTVTVDELINLCRSQLANFKVPKSNRVHFRAAKESVRQGRQARVAYPRARFHLTLLM